MWICLAVAIFDILLAVGARKQTVALLVVWQIFMMLYIILLFACCVIWPIAIYGYRYLYSMDDTFKKISIAITIVLPFIYVYFWVIVNSLKDKIAKEAEHRQARKGRNRKNKV